LQLSDSGLVLVLVLLLENLTKIKDEDENEDEEVARAVTFATGSSKSVSNSPMVGRRQGAVARSGLA